MILVYLIILPRYDAVNQIALPIHWRDEETAVSLKSEFLPYSTTPHLRINSTAVEDVGQYKCRVDYLFEQTTFHVIDLTVIVPSSDPRIFQSGKLIDRWLEVKENQSLSLSCESVGGDPLPNITWWQDSNLLDQTYEK